MPWRLRITGIDSLNWLAICWASLKVLGITRWTWRSIPALPLPPDGAQHAGLAPAALAGRVVGEDVVELVAAAALEPADVGALAIAVLQLCLGLGLALGDGLVAAVILLGEAEVDERAVPCVADRHLGVRIRSVGPKSLR